MITTSQFNDYKRKVEAQLQKAGEVNQELWEHVDTLEGRLLESEKAASTAESRTSNRGEELDYLIRHLYKTSDGAIELHGNGKEWNAKVNGASIELVKGFGLALRRTYETIDHLTTHASNVLLSHAREGGVPEFVENYRGIQASALRLKAQEEQFNRIFENGADPANPIEVGATQYAEEMRATLQRTVEERLTESVTYLDLTASTGDRAVHNLKALYEAEPDLGKVLTPTVKSLISRTEEYLERKLDGLEFAPVTLPEAIASPEDTLSHLEHSPANYLRTAVRAKKLASLVGQEAYSAAGVKAAEYFLSSTKIAEEQDPVDTYQGNIADMIAVTPATGEGFDSDTQLNDRIGEFAARVVTAGMDDEVITRLDMVAGFAAVQEKPMATVLEKQRGDINNAYQTINKRASHLYGAVPELARTGFGKHMEAYGVSVQHG